MAIISSCLSIYSRSISLKGVRRCVLPRVPITVYNGQTWVRDIVRAVLVDNLHIWGRCDVEGGATDVALILQIKSTRDQRQHTLGCVTSLKVAPLRAVLVWPGTPASVSDAVLVIVGLVSLTKALIKCFVAFRQQSQIVVAYKCRDKVSAGGCYSQHAWSRTDHVQHTVLERLVWFVAAFIEQMCNIRSLLFG